jgi:hypothetical protein
MNEYPGSEIHHYKIMTMYLAVDLINITKVAIRLEF